MEPTRPEFLRSFGRIHGRTLSPHQQDLVDTLLPKLQVQPSDLDTCGKLALEIGFGGGEHLVAQANTNRDTLFIGVEPYINGVAKALCGVSDNALRNVRLHTEDARLLLKTLPDARLDSVFILFPDPWPKDRHKKRRLVNQETLAMIARTHKKGGRLLIASDHEDYCVWILEQLHASPHYTWTAHEQTDWLVPPADWTQTKYQRKTTAEGRQPHFFECVRN